MDFGDLHHNNYNPHPLNAGAMKRARYDEPVSSSETYDNTHNWVNGGSWLHPVPPPLHCSGAGNVGNNTSGAIPSDYQQHLQAPPSSDVVSSSFHNTGVFTDNTRQHLPAPQQLYNNINSGTMSNAIADAGENKARWISGHGQK